MSDKRQSNAGRPTIGVLGDVLSSHLSSLLWFGIEDVVRERDVNLICFPGGALRDPHRPQDQAANVLYELVSQERLDGLIIWGYICSRVDRDQLRAFYERYHRLPLVSVAQQVKGVPSVLVDNYGGMYQSVAHLADVHGCTRIAFIKGNEDFGEHEDRFRAYRDVLAERGLPFDETLVVTDNQREEFCRRNGIVIQDVPYGLPPTRLLLNERKATFDGLAVCEDDSAIGALSELQARGIRVPDDVAIVSFDDMRTGHFTTPSLTTVHNPFYALGQQAAVLLLNLLKGEDIPEEVVVPAPLVVRQSCGCLSPRITRIPIMCSEASGETLATAVEQARPSIVEEMMQVIRIDEALPKVEKEMGCLLDALIDEIECRQEREDHGSFLSTLKDLIQTTADYGVIEEWQDVISALRRRLLPYLEDAQHAAAGGLWERARVMIGEAALRAEAYQALQTERQAQTLREISATLISSTELDQLVDALVDGLPQLGIPGAYLLLYEDPQPYTDLDSAPAWSRLAMAYSEQEQLDGARTLTPRMAGEGQRFRSHTLLSDEIWPRQRFNMVVQPLYLQDRQLGFAMFEQGPRDGSVYDVLRGELSNALNSVMLFNDLRYAREAAEKADRLKTRLLANVSHELRTPLHVILDRTRSILEPPGPQNTDLSADTLDANLRYIQRSAEHQLRLINDLLDLSRAEINELDLHLEVVDLQALLSDAFADMAPKHKNAGRVTWQLRLPDRLPVIQADPIRLRQIILNLLSNARKFTTDGDIVLGAEMTSSRFHIWVRDTGPGIPLEQQERIFEPFTTIERTDRRLEGVGLGLSITRRLVALHRGQMALDSEPGEGSTFHLYLPLPRMGDGPIQPVYQSQPVLWLIASDGEVSGEIVTLCREQDLEMRRIQIGDNVKGILEEEQPLVLAWDLRDANPAEWALIQQLRKLPQLTQVPFILYEGGETETQVSKRGLTSVIDPAMAEGTLLKALERLCLLQNTGPILIVDDDSHTRIRYREILSDILPGQDIRVANDGAAALDIMSEESPSLVLLDLMMPKMDGFAVLDWMRSSTQHWEVPVIILSQRMLTFDDIRRIEGHKDVLLQSKGILAEDEIAASLYRSLFGTDRLSSHTSALVKRSLAFICQNYDRSFSREELAESVSANPRYLTRIFSEELGISPWDYLNRYRISKAKDLLRHTDESITEIAMQVGFNDAGYFSRVFHRLTHLSPTDYRQRGD